VRDIEVRKLYVVKDDAEDIDMLILSHLLHPFDYKLVRVACSGREVKDVIMAYHEECIDELEFEVIKNKRTLYDVMYDLYGIDSKEKVYMRGMIFIAETNEGEYVEFSISDVHDIMWDDFVEVEEELEEEEEEDEWEEDVWDGVDVPEAEKEWL